jgi:hypothetical protein
VISLWGTEGKERWEGGLMETYHPLYGNGRVEVELSSAKEVQSTATTTEGMTGGLPKAQVCVRRCTNEREWDNES